MKKFVTILLIVIVVLQVYFIGLQIFQISQSEKDWSVFNNFVSPILGMANIIVLIVIAKIANEITDKNSDKNIASQKKLKQVEIYINLYNEVCSVLDRINFLNGDEINTYSIDQIGTVKSYIFRFQQNFSLVIDDLIKDQNVLFDIQNSLAGMARSKHEWEKTHEKKHEDEYRKFLVSYYNQAQTIKTFFQLFLKK